MRGASILQRRFYRQSGARLVPAEYGQDASALDSSGRARVPLVVSARLGYKVCVQHSAVLSGDNGVFDLIFEVEGFFYLWQNVGRFSCHGLNNKSNSDEEKTMTPKEIFQTIKDKDVKFVDLRFTDTRGKEQHVSVPVKAFGAGQIRIRPLFRRFLDRRMEGHSGFGHGADAGSDFLLYRSVPGADDAGHHLRRHRTVRHEGL